MSIWMVDFYLRTRVEDASSRKRAREEATRRASGTSNGSPPLDLATAKVNELARDGCHVYVQTAQGKGGNAVQDMDIAISLRESTQNLADLEVVDSVIAADMNGFLVHLNSPEAAQRRLENFPEVQN